MESVYLRTLLEVIEAGSFSKAAVNLCVTQSAVSRRLKFLEEQYGRPLIDRTGPSPVLTAAGRLIAEKARRLLEIEGELQNELRELEEACSLRFCCTPAFGLSHLPEIMRRFMQSDASLSGLEVLFEVPENIIKGMRLHRFDLAVLDHCDCADMDELEFVPLPEDEIVFVSSPSLGLPAPLTAIDELFGQTIFSRKEGCCSRLFLDQNLAAIGRAVGDFKGIVVIDDLRLIVEAVTAGRGVAFMSAQVVVREIAEGCLVAHRVAGFRHNRARNLLLPPGETGNPARSRFADCILDVVGRFATPV